MSQSQQILAWMQAGNSITPLEALQRFGCLRLGARIYDLRQSGHAISKQTVHDERTGKTYASYSMVRG
ncbi:helix-turn-helix domain-containing protein [Neisseria shayeganii]|nr:helix-turn-helix domain-containing protein [Neisseria shayeganii]QMT41264.1 helix-turn-helix domain-containing protein [Neisseria shayeganii]